MRHRPPLLVVAFACGPLGCSDPSGPLEAPGLQHAMYCAAICEREVLCTGAAQPGCRALCEQDPGARGQSREIWALQASCIAARSCAEWQAGSARADCLELSLAVLPPSESCVAFCSDGAARSFECGGGHSIAECVKSPVCAYRDDILEDANVCNSELDCDARASCMAEAFGGL